MMKTKGLILTLALAWLALGAAAQSVLTGNSAWSGNNIFGGGVTVGGGGGGPGPDIDIEFESAPQMNVSESGSGQVTLQDNTSPSPLRGSFSLRLNSNGGNAQVWTNFASAQNEVWVGMRINWSPASGDNQFALQMQNSGGSSLSYVRLFDAGSPVVQVNGSTTSLSGVLANSTTYYCWFHVNTVTSQADFEFETTNTRVGAGSNYGTVSAAGTSQVAKFFVGLTGVGSTEFLCADEIQISFSGYPSLPP